MNSRTLHILAAAAVIILGVAFVRPYTAERSAEAWQPVFGSLEFVEPRTGQQVDLAGAGDYLIFLEGPAADPLWHSSNLEGVWVELIDLQSGQPLRANPEVDFTFEAGESRVQALSRVRISRADWYRLEVSGNSVRDRGFRVAVHPREPVEQQADLASNWRLGQWGALALVGAFAMFLLVKET